eukprot:7116210-Prymnesium_polylepis.1
MSQGESHHYAPCGGAGYLAVLRIQTQVSHRPSRGHSFCVELRRLNDFGMQDHPSCFFGFIAVPKTVHLHHSTSVHTQVFTQTEGTSDN